MIMRHGAKNSDMVTITAAPNEDYEADTVTVQTDDADPRKYSFDFGVCIHYNKSIMK